MPELLCQLQPVRSAPDIAVVALRGAIDPKNVMTLESALSAASGKGFRTLVLDLGEIRYINSAGLAYLVNLSDLMAARGGSLQLANAQPKVKVVFDLMGLTQFFKLYKTADAAVDAVAARRRPPVPTAARSGARPRSPAARPSTARSVEAPSDRRRAAPPTG